jgi:hypothetical protein
VTKPRYRRAREMAGLSLSQVCRLIWPLHEPEVLASIEDGTMSAVCVPAAIVSVRAVVVSWRRYRLRRPQAASKP